MGIEGSDNLTKEVEQQMEAGIDEADLILFMVDARAGLTPLDEAIGQRLRKLQKPVLLLANKADHPSLDNQTVEFHRLGRGWLIPISVQQNRHREQLLSEILDRLPEKQADEDQVQTPRMKLAIVGRRNVGKSTFVNSLAKAQRMIVSEVPGTTRDSVDVHFNLDGHSFIAIDTPGLRRKGIPRPGFYGPIELSGRHRADGACVFDCTRSIEGRQATGPLHRTGIQALHLRGQQVDQAVDKVPTRWVRYSGKLSDHGLLSDRFHHRPDRQEHEGAQPAQMLYKQAQTRVSTAQINKLLQGPPPVHPPLYQNRRPKIFRLANRHPAAHDHRHVQPAPGFPPSYRRYLMASSATFALWRGSHQAVSAEARQRRRRQKRRQ